MVCCYFSCHGPPPKKPNNKQASPPTICNLWGMDGGWRAGSGAQSDAKRSGQYLRACRCRHGSSESLTLSDTLLDTGLTTRGSPHGRCVSTGDEGGQRGREGKAFRGTFTPRVVSSRLVGPGSVCAISLFSLHRDSGEKTKPSKVQHFHAAQMSIVKRQLKTTFSRTNWLHVQTPYAH